MSDENAEPLLPSNDSEETEVINCVSEICVTCGCGFDNMPIGCKGRSECIAIQHDYCCALGEKPYSVGVVTDKSKGEQCRTDMYCCSFALFEPKLYFKFAHRTCCMSEVGSFPFDDEYVPDCNCAYVGIQCCPEVAFCVKAPPSGMLTKLDNTKMFDLTTASTFEMTQKQPVSAPTAEAEMER